MPKNHSNNIYQTTVFNQYPPEQRAILIEKRKRIINHRIQSQSHFNYPETANYFWKQSEVEAKELTQWLKNNPPPALNSPPFTNPFTKCKRWLQQLSINQYPQNSNPCSSQ
ncbi:hypothetical protein [Commensalibacter communis]|uniref:hypothetical protein n=1 Tax=Commensalibacter communis TaxID=2972786 RepID=UPI00233102A0|nr:hypothetical protein [Commensalibacter communis]